MNGNQIPPFDTFGFPQQSFQRTPDSRANIDTNLSPQPPPQQAHSTNNDADIVYDYALNLPVYSSAIKSDWFTHGTDNNWYYIRTDANGIVQRRILFQIEIASVTIIDADNVGRFRFLSVDYFSAGSSMLHTVIPFERFIRKKLQDYFLLPAGFRIPNAKDNVSNEFLFFLIMNCKNQKNLKTYSLQGWNLGVNNELIFECENRYDATFKEYLPASVVKRSNPAPYIYGERYLNRTSSVLPNEWEYKFLIALRISSLMLTFTHSCLINPKQLFVFESTDAQITNLISVLLKTNNFNDKESMSLSTPQDKLLSYVSEVSDGIAVIFDTSSTGNSKATTASLSLLSNHLLNNARREAPSKQLIAIISQFAQYDIDPEKYYALIIDKLPFIYDYGKVLMLLTEIDHAVISYFNGREYKSVIEEYYSFIGQYTAKQNVPLELKDTYSMINAAMTIFNKILHEKSQSNPDTIYKPYFEAKDIPEINKFLSRIDRTGQNKTQRIIESFVESIDSAIESSFKCIPISEYISDMVTDNVLLTDDDSIFVSPAAFDSVIIPNMRVRISHRPLIKTLVSNGIIAGEYHNCCRIQYTDISLKRHQIYRYRINRSILSDKSQVVIDKAANAEFFHDLSKARIRNFIPFVNDEKTNTWSGRIIESGDRNNNHMIITGESGAGKSSFMIRTAAYLAELGDRIILFDSSASNTYSELCGVLSKEYVDREVEIYDLDKQKFPVDPFSLEGLKRKDSKANRIYDILHAAIYDSTAAQNAKLKSLIYENIDVLEKDGRISPDSIKKILAKDTPTLSALYDKLIPLLVALSDNINYVKKWSDYLGSTKKILVFSMSPSSNKQGDELFDILLASIYHYHIKHRDSSLWLCIDEICNQNLSEDGVINKIFTQGRKSRISIIGATQKFELSRSDEWTTLNNAKTKVFFKPLSTSISDVMKELNMPQSKRAVFSNMENRECIISSELFSSKEKHNQTAVIRGKVPNKYVPLSSLYPPAPQYGIRDVDTDPEEEIPKSP